MLRRTRKKSSSSSSTLKWSSKTELVGLEFELTPEKDSYLFPQYTIGLHAWFLDQVRQVDSEFSAQLHDEESEKPFTISALNGEIISSGKRIQIFTKNKYRWYLTALSHRVAQWIAGWIKKIPSTIDLGDVAFKIDACNIVHAPTTYNQLLNSENNKNVTLTFISPTSFRRKGHHFPLPLPTNIFHSYLRRWNNFSGITFEQDDFLAWVDECVLINRCQITTDKVLAGKKGAVTGFTDAIELSLTREAAKQPEYQELFYALGKLAPYCGTGHKTTFGLGQTRLGWSSKIIQDIPKVENLLAKRIEDLAETFKAQRKRTGGNRASEIASKWATILARREMGDSLQVIAQDLEMPYETVKTYAKLARRELKKLE